MTKTSLKDILEILLTPPRAKLIRLLILNEHDLFTIAELTRRVGISTRALRSELETLVKVGVVREEKGEGKSAAARARTARYGANAAYEYMNALSSFVHAVSPQEFDEVEKAVRRVGRLSAIVVSGIFVGNASRPADLIVVGDYINEERLEKVVRTLEPKYGREIRYVVFSTPEFRYRLTIHDRILRDTLDHSHRVLFDKHNLL